MNGIRFVIDETPDTNTKRRWLEASPRDSKIWLCLLAR